MRRQESKLGRRHLKIFRFVLYISRVSCKARANRCAHDVSAWRKNDCLKNHLPSLRWRGLSMLRVQKTVSVPIGGDCLCSAYKKQFPSLSVGIVCAPRAENIFCLCRRELSALRAQKTFSVPVGGDCLCSAYKNIFRPCRREPSASRAQKTICPLFRRPIGCRFRCRRLRGGRGYS